MYQDTRILLDAFADYIDTHDPAETPILTAYVGTNPARMENQRERPAWALDLKNEAKSLFERLDDAKLRRRENLEKWEETEARLSAHLTEGKRSGRGVVIFSDHTDEVVIDVPVELPTKLYYGLPQLKELLFLMNSHQKYLVVLLSGTNARFAEVSIAGVEEGVTVDVDPYRLRHLGRKANTLARARRELAFDRRYAREVAALVDEELRQGCYDRVILGGNVKSAHAVRAALRPAGDREVAMVAPIHFEASVDALAKAVKTFSDKHTAQKGILCVEEVLSIHRRGGPALLDQNVIEKTLNEGRVRKLVLPYPLPAKTFDALVVNAVRSNTEITFVTGEAARVLNENGPVAALLYYN